MPEPAHTGAHRVATRIGAARRWRFRLGSLALLIGIFTTARVLRAALIPEGRPAELPWERVAVLGSFGWAIAVLPAAFSIIGLLTFRGLPAERHGRFARPRVPATPHEVCFRVVSRGRNRDALEATVDNVRRTMTDLPLFRWRIEVVVDEPVDLPPWAELQVIVVPAGYATPHRSRFKARALHYALLHSDLPMSSWVFHLDEESQITPSLVAGIRDAVVEEERTGQHRIGQGTILYHRNLDRHPFLTLADSLRTADDVSRFWLQYRLGRPMFGMHGSFILVRTSVAREVGFDVGPENSVTEDACWALQHGSRGRRVRWVDGYLVEQSTEAIGDFVRQRRRWFAGLWLVVLYADVRWWLRLPLTAFLAGWAMAWVGAVYTFANGFLGLATAPWISLAGDVALTYYVTAYVIGLTVNLQHRERVSLARRVRLYVGQVLLIPVFGILEAAGVLLAIIKPDHGFHVVQKSATTAPARPVAPAAAARLADRPLADAHRTRRTTAAPSPNRRTEGAGTAP
ncbi:MAG TPA: glycosyltransferase family 2 protein, partial [Acidimicrobiales bacterium]|nr:glycosyltransferase family 2 protein [Acidimicrobiales bacterium]